MAHALDDIPEEFDCKHNGHYQHDLPPHNAALESNLGEADCGATPMFKENLAIEVQPMAGSTCGHDPTDNEFQGLINTMWHLYHYPEDCKQDIRSFQTHYPKSRNDRHFNEDRLQIPKHFPYNAKWVIYNQLYTMNNQLPK
jgi:hypothetical protein